MDTEDSGDRPITEFAPSSTVVAEWTAIGTGFGLVAAFAFTLIYLAGTGTAGLDFEGVGVGTVALYAVAVLVSIAAVIVVHEAVHAAVIRGFGGDVSFGVGVAQFFTPYAYVTTTERLSRNRFVLVLLAPLFAISAVGVPVMVALDWPLLIVPLSFNAAGAIGDLWMTGLVLRYPAHVTVEDSVTGITIYGRESDRPLAPTQSRVLLRRVGIASVVAFVVLFFALFAAPLVFAILDLPSVAIGTPGTPWSIFFFGRTSGGGFDSGFNPLGVAATSVLVGTGVAILWTAFQRDPPVAGAGSDD